MPWWIIAAATLYGLSRPRVVEAVRGVASKYVPVANSALVTLTGGVAIMPGLSLAHSKIKMNSELLGFCQRLRLTLPVSKWPEIVIDSGVRSYATQASAMVKNLTGDISERGSSAATAYFLDLYGEAGRILLTVSPRTAAAWTPVVQSLYERRLLNPKGHVGGLAVDIRAIGTTPEQREALREAAMYAGAVKVLYETVPNEMMHVEIKGAV